MAASRMSKVIQHLRRATFRREGAEWTDGQLLECFVRRQDEAAMEALVRRYGPMVWGVCRRILRNHHDTEDAFQATFLVLVRKASSIKPREMVANFLYGVAHQTALKARATGAKRWARERPMTPMPEPEATPQGLRDDLQLLLDQELSRLPDKYRVLVVLCDLEGKTRKEAAKQLGVPEGTVAGRLARARTMLAKRLTRQGSVLSAGALAMLLSENALPASVPLSVVSSTIQVATLVAAGQTAAARVMSAKALALTEGVLKTMLLNKLRIAAAVLLTASLLAGGVGATRWSELYAAQRTDTVGQERRPVDALEGRTVRTKNMKTPSKRGAEKPKPRMLRWQLKFQTKDSDEYAKQLEALGAILAVPAEVPGQYRVLRDLSKKAAPSTVEDLAKFEERVFWMEDNARSLRGLSKALGLGRPPQYLIVLLPRFVEDELLRKELAYARRHEKDIHEEDILEATFKFSHTETGFNLTVASQRRK
jgi:RNA polymerase sigma factor (sigma-70 family)